MVSIYKINSNSYGTTYKIVGLSTDAKPQHDVNGYALTNGSQFVEMDTSTLYLYDAENKTWHLSQSHQ